MIHFRNDHACTGWITNCVDILDKGKVPILFSVEQMRNLRMNVEHTPVGEFLACPLFGMQRAALAQLSVRRHYMSSNVQHVTLNIVHTHKQRRLQEIHKASTQYMNQHKSRNQPRQFPRRMSTNFT